MLATRFPNRNPLLYANQLDKLMQFCIFFSWPEYSIHKLSFTCFKNFCKN